MQFTAGLILVVLMGSNSFTMRENAQRRLQELVSDPTTDYGIVLKYGMKHPDIEIRKRSERVWNNSYRPAFIRDLLLDKKELPPLSAYDGRKDADWERIYYISYVPRLHRSLKEYTWHPIGLEQLEQGTASFLSVLCDRGLTKFEIYGIVAKMNDNLVKNQEFEPPLPEWASGFNNAQRGLMNPLDEILKLRKAILP